MWNRILQLPTQVLEHMWVGEDMERGECQRRLGCVDACACDTSRLVFQTLDRQLFGSQVGLEELVEHGPVADTLVRIIFS